MMRVLFVSLSERSHLYCMTPLAWALRTAGHDVRVASSPRLTPAITAAGLTALPVGADHDIYRDMVAFRESQDYETANWSRCRPGELTWPEIRERYALSVPYAFAIYNDSMMDDLAAVARDWKPDLVIRDPLAYAGAIAAGISGAAHARLMWCDDVWGTTRQTFLELRRDAPGDEQDDPLAEWLSAAGEPHGLRCDEQTLQGQATIVSLPPSLRTLTTASPAVEMRFVPYNGSAVVWDWLREEPKRPRVCVSLGTSNTEDYGGDYVRLPEVLEALAQEDLEVVAALLPAQCDALGAVPDNVRVVDSVALHTLLPSCAAVIHHGGYGSYATAMVCGVPQLILSTSVSDHEMRGRALRDAGAGVFVHHRETTGEQVREHVRALVHEPGYASAAARVAAEAEAMPSPHELVPTLERLAHNRGWEVTA